MTTNVSTCDLDLKMYFEKTPKTEKVLATTPRKQRRSKDVWLKEVTNAKSVHKCCKAERNVEYLAADLLDVSTPQKGKMCKPH